MTHSIFKPGRQLSPNLSGWFALAFSQEVKPGKIIRTNFLNHDLVIFRTKHGVVSVLSAYCPHLGAHLAEGGTVVNDNIQCPFHGFRYNTKGLCTYTPYNKTPKISVKNFRSVERHGVILFFYSQEKKDISWDLYPMEKENEEYNWSPSAHKSWIIKTHPQEILENTVDIGHFSPVHGYQNIYIEKPFAISAQHLNMGYYFERKKKPFGSMRVSIKITVSGLGYSRVQAYEHRTGLRIRTVVMPTPIAQNQVQVRVTTQIAAGKKNNKLKNTLINSFLGKITLLGFAKYFMHKTSADFFPDIRIWENKKFVAKPKLTKEDGPILAYRRWAKQFYEH